MGKLTDYIDDKRAKEENINSHNIIKNESAFQRFIENIEDLDFSASFISHSENEKEPDKGIYDLRVLLDESPIKYPNSEGYPYIVRIDTGTEVIYMGPSKMNYHGNKNLTNLAEYLNDTLPVPHDKKLEEDKADIAVKALKVAINS